MGMFKWLKRELRSNKKEQSKSSLSVEHIGSPTSKCIGNDIDDIRDADYLRKLSKFNEWRSSHVSLRQDQLIEDKRHNDRRMSQADFRSTSDKRRDVRYSLDNQQLQHRNIDKNDVNITPRNSRNIENYYITDKSQTEPKSYYQNNYKDNNIKNGSTQVRRELARIDMTFNRKSICNASQKRRKDRNNYNSNESLNKNLFNSPKKWMLENDSECIQNSFNEISPRSESPPEFFYRENSLPFSKCEDTYQWVVNKHGEVVEYALPYNERSVDIAKRNLSDIIENDSHSEGRSDSGKAVSANSTFSLAHSLNQEYLGEVENECSNVRHHTPDQGLGDINTDTYKINRRPSKEMEDPLVSRCGTNVSNDKVAKRLSEKDLKLSNKTGEKRPNLQEDEFFVDGKSTDLDSSHNQEFLDAIEDLVNLGRWSRRQLEPDEIIADIPPKNHTELQSTIKERAPERLSVIQPINPLSELLSCPVVHISSLSISDEVISSSLENILEWRHADWCQQDVCVRTPRQVMIHLHRTQTAMARDVHVLRNVPHRSIALLMAIAYDDKNQIITIMEPFAITLNQLLHSQPFESTLQLSTYCKFIQQICSALTFLHARGFIHSNISSHCILINQSQTEAKLAGFDLAVSIDKDFKKSYRERKQFEYSNDNIQSSNSSNGDLSNQAFLKRHNSSNKEIRKKSKEPKRTKSSTVCDTCVWGEEQLQSDRTVLGHYQWQAPELFLEENSKVRPCTASDIYSLSLVLLECCTETVPWKDVSSEELGQKYENNIFIDIPTTLEVCYKQLIKKGSELNPNLRNLTPSVLMTELNNTQQNDTSNTFIWKNENHSSHSRLLDVLKNCSEDEKNSADELIPNNTLDLSNQFKDEPQFPKSDEKDNSGPEKYYTELNSNKIEFTLEDTKRMTASDFIRQLEIETTNLTRMLEASTNIKKTPVDKKLNNIGNYEYSSPYNVFNSPLNDSNTTEYYSLAEKSSTKNLTNQNTEYKNLINNTISPIVENTQTGKLLLNVTPRFYTPLQIQTPATTPKDVPINNSPEAGKADSIYSFDIEDYELPETPIARNTKIRRNAWLSEQKQMLDIGKENKMSVSFGGYQCDNEYNEKQLDTSKEISNDVQNHEVTPIQKKINELVQEIQSDPIPLHQDQKTRRNIRIHNVKTKLNDILAKGLNCGTNCITSTPTRTSPFSSSYSLDRKYTKKEKVLFSPVKPASHSTEPKFTYVNQSQEDLPEINKPAINEEEHVAIINQEQEQDKSIPEDPEPVEEIKTNNKAYNNFEDALWKLEKNKCDHNSANKVTITSSYIDCRNVEDFNRDRLSKSFNSDITPEKRLLPVSVQFTTLPRRLSAKFIVRPEKKFLTQVCRSDSVMSKKRNVLEIAKLFEKRNSFVVNSSNNKPGGDCSDDSLSESKLDNRKSAKLNKFNNEGAVKSRLDQSFIYNNALDQSGNVAEKVCSHCGSPLKQPVNQEQEETRRLTLGPEIAEICANILRSSDSLWQVSDVDSRCLVGAFEFGQSPLKRCQAFPAIQNARSTEDLYIDDEFSAENLGSHMQLTETRNDIFYRECDVFSINLSDNPLSINLTELNDEECVEDSTQTTDSASHVEEQTETSL